MSHLFLACAVIGGMLFLFQFGMSLLGLGDHEMEIADDLELSGDWDALGDADLDTDLDLETDAEVSEDGEAGSSSSSGSITQTIFGVLSFRTVVAAVMFFGLAGRAMQQAGQTPAATVLVAAISGVAALFCVHAIMRTLYRLGQDGTVKIQDTVGRTGTVYIPIPADRVAPGRVQVRLDDRIVEYQAVTSNPEKLATGDPIIVTDVLGPAMVEVEPDSEVLALSREQRSG